MPNLFYDYRVKPWEIYGGKRPLFVRYADFVADVIKEFKLKPIEGAVFSPTTRVLEKRAASATEPILFDPDIFGGKRFAHLHYRGEVYMLNQSQWQTFTAKVKEDIIQRLQKADTISLEEIQDLNDVVDPLA